MGSKDSKLVDATTHSFRILERLIAADRELGVTDLAESVGLSKGVVYNHLYTLSELGYVTKRGRSYAPSLSTLKLGDGTRRRYPLFRVAQSHVDNLARTTSEVSMLVVEEDGVGVPIHIAPGTETWLPDYCCGERLPLYTLAPGKAILASMDPQRAREILNEGDRVPTGRSLPDRERLREELKTVREKGVAFSREERSTGVVGVAAPIGLNERGPAAAIGVCGPADRLSGRHLEEDITGQVLSTAKSIQVDLANSTG